MFVKLVIPPGIAIRAVPVPAPSSTTCHLERSVSGVERSLIYEILLPPWRDGITPSFIHEGEFGKDPN